MIWGYEDKITLFKKLINENKLAQAYLFYGEPEIGKFTFAKKIALFLETANEKTEKPLIDTLIFDYKENESIGIKEIIEAENFLYQMPLISERKTLIINNAENLTQEAQAALLKIIEEPPEKGLIIFITQNPYSLYETLLSRMIKIYFPILSKEKIKKGLMEIFGLGENDAEKIAKESLGRMGRAINILNKKIKESDEEIENYISSLILKLYTQNLQKNSFLLKLLLEKETFIKKYKKYNLNIKLQKKALEILLKKHGRI